MLPTLLPIALPYTQEVSTIAHVIELAIAPVFLITGIGALLAVMSNRLARIIDRARQIETKWHFRCDTNCRCQNGIYEFI